MNIHKEMLEFVKRERVVTSSDVAGKFKISWNTAESYLKDLAIEGKIEKIKKKGVNLWMVK